MPSSGMWDVITLGYRMGQYFDKFINSVFKDALEMLIKPLKVAILKE